MAANWLKERLDAARREIDKWPDWRKKELEAEINRTPTGEPEDLPPHEEPSKAE